MRAVPTGGKWKFTTCTGARVGRRSFRNCRVPACLHEKRNDIDFALTEAQRGFNRLSQSFAIFLHDNDAVLNDLNARAEAFDFRVTIYANNVAI